MKQSTGRVIKNRKVFLIVSGLLISLLLFVLQLEQRVFISGAIKDVFYSPFFSLTKYVTRLVDVYEINTELMSEIVRLRLEKVAFLESKVENERFREMMNLLPRSGYQLIPADVIAYDQGRRLSTAIIKSSEAMKRFSPVLDEYGLVGKISTTDDKISTVSLLVGPNCRVAARDQQTRTLGIVKWQSGKGLYFDDVSLENTVLVGDTLISSGLGGVFPEGLLIGFVSSVDTIPTQFFKMIKVKSAVNFGALDNLVVLDIMENKE